MDATCCSTHHGALEFCFCTLPLLGARTLGITPEMFLQSSGFRLTLPEIIMEVDGLAPWMTMKSEYQTGGAHVLPRKLD